MSEASSAPSHPPDDPGGWLGLSHLAAGRLLVAMPSLRDPNFARTVVYLLDHDDSTLGVVLNRPSRLDVLDLAPKWWSLAAEPRRVHVGGPCQGDAALAVAVGRSGLPDEALRAVCRLGGETVYVLDLDADPDGVLSVLSGVRLFAGYAGWGAGQLAEEIAEGAWVCVSGRASDVLARTGVDLWRDVLDRQSGPGSFLRSCTDNPQHN